jgi:hemoglobin
MAKAKSASAEKSLYERLGGEKKIKEWVTDIFWKHKKNPLIKNRYINSDPDEVIRKVTEMVCAGTGGTQTYTGKDMVSAHRGMNINDQEFIALVDDVMEAMKEYKYGEREQQEILYILYSLKNEVVHL